MGRIYVALFNAYISRLNINGLFDLAYYSLRLLL